MNATTTRVEKEPADRFPPARLQYLMWSRQQAETARAMEPEEEAPADDTPRTDKFNQKDG